MKMQKNKKLVQAAAVGLSVCVLAGGGLFDMEYSTAKMQKKMKSRSYQMKLRKLKA